MEGSLSAKMEADLRRRSPYNGPDIAQQPRSTVPAHSRYRTAHSSFSASSYSFRTSCSSVPGRPIRRTDQYYTPYESRRTGQYHTP
eukprot:1473532-Rhodomonas_salina.1